MESFLDDYTRKILAISNAKKIRSVCPLEKSVQVDELSIPLTSPFIESSSVLLADLCNKVEQRSLVRLTNVQRMSELEQCIQDDKICIQNLKMALNNQTENVLTVI
ncbi:hypothetical protein ACOME3_006083 [Neoechinorhynchus agilis]